MRGWAWERLNFKTHNEIWDAFRVRWPLQYMLREEERNEVLRRAF